MRGPARRRHLLARPASRSPAASSSCAADLVLIAIGFIHPEHDGPIDELGVDLDRRGNVKAPDLRDLGPGVFACGDARTGQSLVVTAIAEGRRCARVVDRALREGHVESPAAAAESA